MRYLVMSFVFLLSAEVGAVGDPKVGKAKAGTCVSCHGTNGISTDGLSPNLAGQQDLYMIKQFKDFRDGTRDDPFMSPISKTLNDQDIDDIAAYFKLL